MDFGCTLCVTSLVPRPRPAFHCLQCCKRQKVAMKSWAGPGKLGGAWEAGRGLGMRLVCNLTTLWISPITDHIVTLINYTPWLTSCLEQFLCLSCLGLSIWKKFHDQCHLHTLSIPAMQAIVRVCVLISCTFSIIEVVRSLPHPLQRHALHVLNVVVAAWIRL